MSLESQIAFQKHFLKWRNYEEPGKFILLLRNAFIAPQYCTSHFNRCPNGACPENQGFITENAADAHLLILFS